jgi:uncharacterized protein DUF2878
VRIRASRAWSAAFRNRLIGAFLLGATLGTALDAIHAYGDVESYPNDALDRLAWFVPLEFGLAGIAVAFTIPVLERVAGEGRPREWSAWERVRELPLLAGLYVTSVAANGPGNAAFLVGLLVLLAVRLTFGEVRGDWAFALVAGVVGPAAEAIIHATGAFDYTEPDFLGIPMWLPALWANAGLSIRRIFGPLSVPEADEAPEGADIG